MAKRHDDEATRRRVLRAGLAVIGGVAGFVASRVRADDKIAQNQVQYQNTPKDGQKCGGCFEAPNGCKIVAGTIDPQGWCIAFAPKEG